MEFASDKIKRPWKRPGDHKTGIGGNFNYNAQVFVE